MLTIIDVQRALHMLGYYDGPPSGDPTNANFRDDLKRFQRDYGLVVDGWYGQKTESKLLPLVAILKDAPPGFGACRRWQLTCYYVGDAAAWKGPLVTMKRPDGSQITRLPAGAFAEAALEGASRLADGLVGVASPPYSPCSASEFSPVYDIAKRNGWIPDKPGYAGIVLSADNKTAIGARNFDTRLASSKGWPIEAKGIACDPFRTIAADNGQLAKHDPQFKGKGGVVPAGTRVWILELVGQKLPDGTTHDGWCTVNDTGGGIFGAHFDVFTGTKQLASKVKIPGRAHIWFAGIEDRLPIHYSYGL